MSLSAADASAPAAEVDRRFLALVVDRLVGWGLMAGIGWAAWRYLGQEGRTALAWGVAVAGVLLVGLVFAVLTGTRGVTPGKALLGLRVVHHGTGTPIGVGPAVLRSLIVFAATVPLGFGLVTLAWTAVTDQGRQRRGFHDLIANSVVLDVRRRAADEAPPEDEAPRHVVNLTAMRLRPAPADPTPARQPAPVPQPAPVSQPAPAPPPAPPAHPQPVR
ncbi:RDD family protein, partial [Nocardioides sp. ChNu-99]